MRQVCCSLLLYEKRQTAHCWSYYAAMCAKADPILRGHSSLPTVGELMPAEVQVLQA